MVSELLYIILLVYTLELRSTYKNSYFLFHINNLTAFINLQFLMILQFVNL